MTRPDNQIATRFVAITDHASAERWLGLVVDHRNLFEALSDGWLRPLRQRKGLLVSVGAYALERCGLSQGNRILVRVKLDPKRLPTLDVAVFRDGQWTTAALQDIGPSDQTVYWPGVLPTFAVSQLTVSTEEERSRLLQMTRITANLDLREVPVFVGAATDEILEPSISPPELAPQLEVPDSEDAIHGALSMAVWGVPRMAPWMDLLHCQSGIGPRTAGSFVPSSRSPMVAIPALAPLNRCRMSVLPARVPLAGRNRCVPRWVFGRCRSRSRPSRSNCR